jgi:hypothetical protein
MLNLFQFVELILQVLLWNVEQPRPSLGIALYIRYQDQPQPFKQIQFELIEIRRKLLVRIREVWLMVLLYGGESVLFGLSHVAFASSRAMRFCVLNHIRAHSIELPAHTRVDPLKEPRLFVKITLYYIFVLLVPV